MKIGAKIIFGLCGLSLIGPLGLVVGLIIGHYFDLNKPQLFNLEHAFKQFGFIGAQQIFIKTSFAVMGYISKADGRVTENEIQYARTVMTQMRMGEAARRQAINQFNYGKSANFNFNRALIQLKTICKNYRNLQQMFVEIQFQAAKIDQGIASPGQQAILTKICQTLGFNPDQDYQQKTNFYQRQHANINALDSAYQLLGIESTADQAQLKRAYRKKMSEYHPDKLIAKGLSEQAVKQATEKTQKIKAAYEQICQAKGY